MKILFFGDSITDMGRNRECEIGNCWSYGIGYPSVVASKLSEKDPLFYQVINRGISGNRIVDLYARIKCDVWNLQPDVLSILIGINDIWHELSNKNGVDIVRFEKFYRMIIEETKQVLPNTKIMILEPFVLKGIATEAKFEQFSEIRTYAKVIKKIAEDYNLPFVPLQDKFDEMSNKFNEAIYLHDGVHPNVAGATLIANEWLKVFEEKVNK